MIKPIRLELDIRIFGLEKNYLGEKVVQISYFTI